MTVNIESLKEFGIGMWFMYISYEVYAWISGMNITSFVIGAVVCTVFALFFVACMVTGMYLIARGAINIVNKEDCYVRTKL